MQVQQAIVAPNEYKYRQNDVAKIAHWDMSKKCGLPAADKWYEHEPERVVDSDKAKLLWDFLIQTDHEIQSRRPDIVFLDKEGNQCFIVDIAVPGDACIVEKEKKKDGKVPRSQERNYKIVEHQDLCCVCGSRCTWHDFKKS